MANKSLVQSNFWPSEFSEHLLSTEVDLSELDNWFFQGRGPGSAGVTCLSFRGEIAMLMCGKLIATLFVASCLTLSGQKLFAQGLPNQNTDSNPYEVTTGAAAESEMLRLRTEVGTAIMSYREATQYPWDTDRNFVVIENLTQGDRNCYYGVRTPFVDIFEDQPTRVDFLCFNTGYREAPITVQVESPCRTVIVNRRPVRVCDSGPRPTMGVGNLLATPGYSSALPLFLRTPYPRTLPLNIDVTLGNVSSHGVAGAF